MAKRYEPIHMVLDDAGEVYALTASDEILEGMMSSTPLYQTTLSVFRDVSPLVALQYLEGVAPWRKLRDDEAWQRLSQAIPEFQKHMLAFEENHSEPLYRQIPPDFPPFLVEERTKVLEKFPRVSDLTAARELTEIAMAAIHRRDVDTSHFRQASLETSWVTVQQLNTDTLYERLDHLDRQISTDHGEDPRWSARMTAEFNEVRHLIDERDQPEPGLSPS